MPGRRARRPGSAARPCRRRDRSISTALSSWAVTIASPAPRAARASRRRERGVRPARRRPPRPPRPRSRALLDLAPSGRRGSLGRGRRRPSRRLRRSARAADRCSCSRDRRRLPLDLRLAVAVRLDRDRGGVVVHRQGPSRRPCRSGTRSSSSRRRTCCWSPAIWSPLFSVSDALELAGGVAAGDLGLRRRSAASSCP